MTGVVARGMLMLDHEIPDWYELVDLDELDLGCGSRCVLGQIANKLGWDSAEPHRSIGCDPANAYHVALDHLGIGGLAGRLGFGSPMVAGLATWDELTEVWREAIRSRLLSRELVCVA